jgi:hypothetical protein
VVAVSRFMGSSITMIDYRYGHLAHDSRDHAVSRFDALALSAWWTPGGRRRRSPKPCASVSRPLQRRFGVRRGRLVDVRARSDAENSGSASWNGGNGMNQTRVSRVRTEPGASPAPRRTLGR